MTDDSKKMKVVFAPGVLEQMERDIDPEELQEILDEIAASIENGTLLDDSRPVDLDELLLTDPDLYFDLIQQISNMEEIDLDQPKRLH